MKIVVIDDEKHCRDFLVSELQKHFIEITEITEAEGVQTGLEAILLSKPDVVFLDIKLKGGSGFDILSKLESVDFKLVFTTAYDQYAIKAFEYSAVHYLLKPFATAQLVEACNRAFSDVATRQALQSQQFIDTYNKGTFDTLSLRTENDFHIVSIKDIVFLEASGSYCQFNLAGKKPILVSKPLKEYQQLLPASNFMRSHKSFLVNLEMVLTFRYASQELVTRDRQIILVARRNKTAILSAVQSHPHIEVALKG